MKRLLVILACLTASVLADAAPPATLKIVTWNLQWFPGGRTGASKAEQDRHIEVVRESIRKLSPDIILLQEVGSAGALEETLKPLGPEWKVAVVSRFMQGNFLSGQQTAIAARIPAEAAWAESWVKGWAGAPRGYAYASFLVDGKHLAVYSIHLKSNIGNAAENTSKREDAVEQLLAHINTGSDRVAKADAIVIGGDFNTDNPDTPAAQSPGERTFGLLNKAGFKWGFDGIAHKDRITCPRKGRYPDACFDHVFTRGLGAPLSSVAVVEGSDHRPVAVEASIHQAEAKP